jgi:hypothetical protein
MADPHNSAILWSLNWPFVGAIGGSLSTQKTLNTDPVEPHLTGERHRQTLNGENR